MKPRRLAKCPRCGEAIFRARLRDMPAARVAMDPVPVVEGPPFLALTDPAPGQVNGDVYLSPPLYRVHECVAGGEGEEEEEDFPVSQMEQEP